MIASIKARIRLLNASARVTRRRRKARLLRSPLLGWLRGPVPCDEIVLVPSELRSPDPGFLDELEGGMLGLSGRVVHVGRASPFALPDADTAWLRELHGFGWLVHLGGPGTLGQDRARALVRDWLDRCDGRLGTWSGIGVTARRVISWITHAPLVLDAGDPDEYDRILASLARQLHRLQDERHESAPGPDALNALIALLLAALTISSRADLRAATEAALEAELAQQIRPDGSHVSRNAAVVLALLLDLLPLRRCYAACGLVVPGGLAAAVDHMLGFLRAMRLGDGSLACHNGASPIPVDELATVLSVDAGDTLSSLAAARYVRLAAGRLVVVMDCGPPPPLEHSASAAAGCLSFEASDGEEMLVVNPGLPRDASGADRAAARATAAHSTLALAGESSGRLMPYRGLGMTADRAAVIGPENVWLAVSDVGAGTVVEASHDGYLKQHQVIHTRRLSLDPAGDAIIGSDRLGGRHGSLRLKTDLPFAIRFPLAPESTARLADASRRAVEITLRGGRTWQLTCESGELSLEAIVVHGRGNGSRPSSQIVLRAVTAGETTVEWRLQRVA